MDNTLAKLGQIRVFTKVLSKVSQIRNRGAKQKVLNALEKNEYFQRFIHDPIERQQFLAKASPYVKYRFYPKGTAIVELNKPITSFSVIVKGKALLYIPKSLEEIKKEGNHPQKSQATQIYLRYMGREQLEEKFKKWLSNNELGTKALRKRMASLSANDEVSERGSVLPEDDNFYSIIEQILKEDNPLLPPHLRDADLSFEEKVLLLSTFGTPGEIIKNGNLTLKVETELKAGDTFGEVGLVKPIQSNHAVIATEDTHTVSFTKLDYKLLFASGIRNIDEKIEFLRRTFTEIPKQNLMEMAYYLEEKVLFTSEITYKEGDEADAIYLIKHGEIEISTIKESQQTENGMLNDQLIPKAKTKFNEKQRIMVGRLPPGSIFGEEELIKRMRKRKYSAKALQPSTFLYVIKKKIFYEVFEHYFQDIVGIMKDWMDLKYKWREQRIKKEHQIAELRSEEKETLVERVDFENKRRIIKKTGPSVIKMRRTVQNEKEIDSFVQDESTGVLMNSTLRFTNSSPTNHNKSPNIIGPNLYFTKLKRSQARKMSPRNRSQPKVIFQRSDSKELLQTKEGIEKQKTKLFVDNQLKFHKFRRPLLTHKITPKPPSSKRTLEISTKSDLPTPQILNFERAKDIQKAEGQVLENVLQTSFRKMIPLSVSSPRFFIVRSYGVSNASPTSFESDLFLRRHSSYLLREKEQESLSTNIKNLEIRRGTYAGEVKDSKIEEEKHDSVRRRIQGSSKKAKEIAQFMIRPATSLQNFEKIDKSKYQVTSTGGSLAYLDTKTEDISIQDSNSIKNPSLLLKDSNYKDYNFGKKVLSPKTAEQVQVSPRIGFVNSKHKVKGSGAERGSCTTKVTNENLE